MYKLNKKGTFDQIKKEKVKGGELSAVKALEDKIADLTAEVAALRDDVTTKDKTIADLTAEVAKLKPKQ